MLILCCNNIVIFYAIRICYLTYLIAISLFNHQIHNICAESRFFPSPCGLLPLAKSNLHSSTVSSYFPLKERSTATTEAYRFRL